MKKIFLLAMSLGCGLLSLNAQNLTVNPDNSSIEWVGKKIGGKHNGTINLKSGTFKIENNKVVSGMFIVDMTTIKNLDISDETYKKKLEGHLKSDDFFGVEKFPTATFKVTESTEFKNGKARVTGTITIKGKTETITFDFVRQQENYTAELEIDRSKFDVRYGSNSFFDNLGDKAINDIFTLTISLGVK